MGIVLRGELNKGSPCSYIFPWKFLSSFSRGTTVPLTNSPRLNRFSRTESSGSGEFKDYERNFDSFEIIRLIILNSKYQATRSRREF